MAFNLSFLEKKLVGFMELINIIYYVVVYGGTIFFLLIVGLYFISKSRQNQLKPAAEYQHLAVPRILARTQNNQQRLLNDYPEKAIYRSEQNEMRTKNELNKPMIFQLDQQKPRELKIIRKLTVREEVERIKTMHDSAKSNNGKRYTIVNDDLNKSKNRAANFYL